ncbi:hypothetical protein N566_07745 [Streptomycetaceae bacterium MP113-05]|nr:hypothetical protein N566_07745 [Streptomycetaceae bacterium MP113-05]
MGFRLARDGAPLFVYGTLCFEGVLRAQLGRVPRGEPASVVGWRAASLAQRLYPGLVPAPGAVARGRLLCGLTPGEWCALDEFEGAEYALRDITLVDGRVARTYVWRGGGVLAEEWVAESCAARVLAAYGA